MKKLILAILTAIILGSCASSTKNEVAKGLNLNDTNSYIVYLKYQTKVEGYQVSVDFSPRTSIMHGQCCIELYMGKALLHFAKEGSSFIVECEEFSDSSLICYTNTDAEYAPKNEKSIDLAEIESGDTIVLDYLPPKAQEYFSWNSPFYFLDMDFDGRKDLVVNNMGCGYYGGNTYDVFSLNGSEPQKMTGFPFEQGGIKLNSDCEYNPQKKVLSLRVKNGMEIVPIGPDSLFDGDQKVSGSTVHIMAIMKSIADGDAKKLASLTIFPIERRYPLPDIKDYADMVRRFNSVFDAGFRKKMKSAKPSDWHSYGWRGYCYGDSSELWVYDSLTIINYYSPQERRLYGQLVKKEMNSLHASLKGNGWYPYTCYKDITDGSVIRIDIRDRKEMNEENFHKDGVALLYPQLQAFKVRGDEEFRLSIYTKGSALNGKPQTVMNGHVDIGGSANMMDYVFKKENSEIELGDSFYEDGKQLINIKKNDQELSHEIKKCYWLELIK